MKTNDSGENPFHSFIWKMNKYGYTSDVHEAGRFNEEQAKELVESDYDEMTMMVDESIVKKLIEVYRMTTG